MNNTQEQHRTTAVMGLTLQFGCCFSFCPAQHCAFPITYVSGRNLGEASKLSFGGVRVCTILSITKWFVNSKLLHAKQVVN